MSPYITSAASISSLLHYLLLPEPQWNPHPWLTPIFTVFAVLQPALQTLLLAPAILLIRRKDRTPNGSFFEWTSHPDSSLDDLHDSRRLRLCDDGFPGMCAWRATDRRRAMDCCMRLIVAYLELGFPCPLPGRPIGPGDLLFIPRLLLMLAVLLGTYALLWSGRDRDKEWDWTHYAWAGAMTLAMLFSMQSTYRLQRAVRQEYVYRVALKTPSLFDSDPVVDGDALRYIATATRYNSTAFEGYRLVAAGNRQVSIPPPEMIFRSLPARSNYSSRKRAARTPKLSTCRIQRKHRRHWAKSDALDRRPRPRICARRSRKGKAHGAAFPPVR